MEIVTKLQVGLNIHIFFVGSTLKVKEKTEMDFDLLLGLGAFAFIFTLILGAIALTAYIVNAIAVKKYLIALGSDRPWAGWIPIFGNYEMFKVVIDENSDPVMQRVFNVNIDDNIAKWYPVVCFALPVVAGKIFDSYSTRVLANIISSLCSIAGIVGLSASLAAGFALLENKSEKDTRVFAVLQSITGILFWVKAFQLNGNTAVAQKSTRRERQDAIQSVTDTIENEFSSRFEQKDDRDIFVKEAVKKVKFRITAEFAEVGGTKKIKVNDELVKLNIPAGAKNGQTIFIADYNLEGDDLEVSLIVTD